MIKKLIAVLLVLSMSVLLFSCDGNNEDVTTEPVEYVLPTEIIDADITLPYLSSDSLEPYSAKSNINRDLISVIYESLYTVTDNGKGQALLAQSGNIDGKNVKIKLLSDAKFSDGTKITAEYVKTSFEKAKNSVYYKAELSNVASISVADKYTVTFTLYNPDSMALNVLNFPIVKVSQKTYVGSGKYMVEYLEDTPYLSVNVNHRDYDKNWNKQIALYDMAGITSPIYPFKANEISAYKQDLTDGDYINLSSQTVAENMNNLVYVGVNSQWAGSITSIDWVRQAINIGINRAGIVASSFLGQGTPVVTPFKSSFYQLDYENLPDTSGETERAIAILERNGYTTVNSDGVRSDGSNTLRLSILVCTKNKYKLTVANALKESLEELGFGVTITEKKTIKAFTEALEEGHYGLYIGETALTSNCDLTEFFTKNGNLNYGINEEFFAEYSAYKSGENTAMTFVESFATEVPFIPLYYRKTVVSVNPNITGVKGGYDCYRSISNWKIEEKK